MWRHEWEQTKSSGLKEQLLKYNAEDCHALESVARLLIRLGQTSSNQQSDNESDPIVVHTELMPHQTMWPRFSSPLPEFEQANKAARWDYQRERIYIRSSKRIRRIADRTGRARKKVRKFSKRIVVDESRCPKCRSVGWQQNMVTKILHDLRFSQWGLKKWVVEYQFRYYWCQKCQIRFGVPGEFWPRSKFGRNLLAYITYQMVELNTPQATIRRILNRLFAYDFESRHINRFKVHAAAFYRETRQVLLDRIVHGDLVHVDETRANVRGKRAYVWVFANLHKCSLPLFAIPRG